MNSSQNLLLMTATISPAEGTKVIRRDPNLRRSDYLKCFQYWLKHPDPRLRHILFVENSASDLADFHALAKDTDKKVEIISIPPNPPPPAMHYGYSEFQMIDLALSQSQLVGQTTNLIKTTGRLTFPALPRLLDRVPDRFRLVVETRARLPFRPSGQGFVAVQLFLASHEFYNARLRKSYLGLEKSGERLHFIEHLFYERLIPLRNQDGVYLRFPVNCEPVGIAGANGIRYDGFQRNLIAKVRAVSRVVAPNFWL